MVLDELAVPRVSGYISARMAAVYHIFVPEGGSWKWAATVPAPLAHDDAKRALLAMGALRRGQPIRMILIDDSPQPAPPGDEAT